MQASAAILLATSWLSGEDLSFASPEDVGVSSERLGTMHRLVQNAVDSHPLTGAVTLVARDGEIIDWRTFGYRDKLKQTPMQRDDIFAMASLTKCVVSAAAMILVERGEMKLSDPIAKFLPEFANPRVFLRREADRTFTRPAKSAIQVRHLLTHTGGWPGNQSKGEIGAIGKANRYRLAGTLDEMTIELAKMPLEADPGTAWIYGPSTDVLAVLIQRVSGQPFEVFLRENIFDPLGMEDTYFFVPEEKQDRVVSIFTHREGELVYDVPPEDHARGQRAYPSGGGGLYSTPPDYFRFMQMLLNGGSYQGRSILGKKTVDSITRNQTGFLGDKPKSNNRSEAWGFGVSVKIDTAYEKDMSSVGTFGWGGSTTTWCRADPQERYIALIFSQHRPMASVFVPPFANTAWQAIVE
ncbi:MAG: serine hydrolase domain-containing protein [Synoicihabitans sp.]